MKQYYHWCCKGVKNDLIFTDKQEFIAGMNRIGVCLLHCRSKKRSVTVVAFCLLNNHFHFVLYGEEQDTSFFMDHYILLTSRWIQHHRGNRLHGRLELGHWPAVSWEHLLNKLVYTLRQTLEAGIQVTPQGYPWCSARLMFNNNDFLMETGKNAADLSVRERRNIIYSKIVLPGDWIILNDGMIWPGCYTDIALAQSLFSGVKDFMYCMNNGNIDREVNGIMMEERPSIPDTEIRDKANSLSKTLFGRRGVGACSAEERIQIARFLRKDLHCGHKQLARVVMMEETDLKRLV